MISKKESTLQASNTLRIRLFLNLNNVFDVFDLPFYFLDLS